MRSDGLSPETLARLAAQLNPQLACDEPAKAIELARKLLIAADPELATELAKQEADRAEEMQLEAEGMQVQKVGQLYDEVFSGPEAISVADAFNALPPGHYKTEKRFAAALRKENLMNVLADGSELTSRPAVDKLFRLQREADLADDRKRKAASTKKSQKNVAESKGQKAEQSSQKAERKKQKAEPAKQKAERSEST